MHKAMLAIDGIKMSSMRFLDFLNEYISNISNIYNHIVNLRLEYQPKNNKMFLDTKVG